MPDPPPAPPAAPPPQDIAEQAWNSRDLSVMEGCWRLISDYQIFRLDTMVPRSVTSWQMCFDPNGFGSQQLVMDDGTVCSMGVRARFLPDGRMRLADTADTTCSDGTVLVQRTDIDCARLPDGTAHCRYIRPRARLVGGDRPAPLISEADQQVARDGGPSPWSYHRYCGPIGAGHRPQRVGPVDGRPRPRGAIPCDMPRWPVGRGWQQVFGCCLAVSLA